MTTKLSRYVAEEAGLVGELAGRWQALKVTAGARSVVVEGDPVHMDQLSRYIWQLAVGPGLTGQQVHALQTAALQIMELVIWDRGRRGVIW